MLRCVPRSVWKNLRISNFLKKVKNLDCYVFLDDDEECLLVRQKNDATMDMSDVFEAPWADFSTSTMQLNDSEESFCIEHFVDGDATSSKSLSSLTPPSEKGDSDTEEEEEEESTVEVMLNSRSIRFADEVEGQELETVHTVPWSEHDDETWIPRQVRCRVEL